MASYILRRLLQIIVTLFILSFICYGLMNLMPGDPLDLLIQSNPNVTSEDIARLKALYGIDRPMVLRYWSWLQDVISGNLGYSRTYKVPTGDILWSRLFNTFLLSSVAFAFSLIVAIPLGVISALKKGTKFDYFINLFAFSGISIPSFWLGIVLIIIMAVKFKIFPAGGTVSIGHENLGFFAALKDRVYYLVLPVISLSLGQMGSFVRYTRSSMLEILGMDYIRTARAKGLTKNTVIFLHAFKNALIPVITIASIKFSFVFSGAIITESIFSYQGVGKLILESIYGSDYNVAMISFMISIAMVLFMNLLADILYAVVDPRIVYN